MYPILGACSLVSNGGCVNTASVCSPDGTDGLCKCNSTTVDCSLASFPTGFPSFSSVLSSVTQIIMGPNSFTRIPSSAFTGLTSVTKIVLQAESITRVFSGAFLGLPALQEM